jgi:hypothetical protein
MKGGALPWLTIIIIGARTALGNRTVLQVAGAP